MVILHKNYPKVSQPENFKKILLPFQLSTIYKMELMEKKNTKYIPGNHNNYGILSNQFGSGKTITVLGLCKRNTYNIYNTNNKNIGNIYNNNKYIYNSREFINSTLIIIPDILKYKWISEIEDANLSYFIIDNDIRLENFINFKKYDIIICTISFYNKFMELYFSSKWNRIIIDEIDYLLNKFTNCIYSLPAHRYIWFISVIYEKLIYSDCTNSIKYSYFDNDLENFIVKCSYEFINNIHFINENIIVCSNMIIPKITKLINLDNSESVKNSILKLNGNVSSDIINDFTIKINNKISKLTMKKNY